MPSTPSMPVIQNRIELFGIDESWLDMTQTWRLFGSSPAGAADAVRRAVKAETGLTISVGVSFNKVFAKLGSDYKKPDAVTVIDTENFRRIVRPLPVNTLLYVGRSAQNTLAGLGRPEHWAAGRGEGRGPARGAGQAGAGAGRLRREGRRFLPCVPRTSVRKR